MPWATHAQLLTLAHVSAANAKESTITRHPCWHDPLFAQLVHGTLMVQDQQVRQYCLLTQAPHRTVLNSMSELIFTAQSAAVTLFYVYRKWNIEPLFVHPTHGPYVPLALYGLDVHFDQRTVLNALATLTAWHKDPFATTITLNNYVLPPVLLLFSQTTIKTLLRAAPRVDDALTLRLQAFSQFNMDPVMQSIYMDSMSYHDVVVTNENAYTALVNLAGIESLFGVPDKQQRFTAHNAALALYCLLTRPGHTLGSRSIVPILTALMTSGSVLDKQVDAYDRERIAGLRAGPWQYPTDEQRTRLLERLSATMEAYNAAAHEHYENVLLLGKYDQGQFVKVCVKLATTAGSFWPLASLV